MSVKMLRLMGTQDRHRRRLITFVALSFIAGALINLCVAWTAALYLPWRFLNKSEVVSAWPAEAPDDWPIAVAGSLSHPLMQIGLAFGHTPTEYFERPDGSTTHSVRIDCDMEVGRVGWPARSFGWTRKTETKVTHVYYDQLERTTTDLTPSHWQRGLKASNGRILPIAPIWSGMLLNIVFYAGVFAALLFSIRWARFSYRRKTSKCTACGYPRSGLQSVCPECGKRA